MSKNSPEKNPAKSIKTERILGVFALIIIIFAWIFGWIRDEKNILPFLRKTLPKAGHFELLGNKTYAAYINKKDLAPIGYIKTESARGYGGPLTVAVGTDTRGKVTGITIIDHKESPPFFNRILNKGFVNSFVYKTYHDQFIPGHDLDSISGATHSARALADSVRRGVRAIASQQLNLKVPVEKKISLQFGILETVLIALFVLGFVSRRRGEKFKKWARWISMILGLLALGFIYNTPLTISMISQFLLGFWPPWQTGLVWFLLIGGIVLLLFIEKKNPYCEWFCPFGATQECVEVIGKARKRLTGSFRPLLKWLQRFLSLSIIVIALLFRNPGLTSYEIFGTFFEFIGSNAQFILLGIVLVMALFVRRPWCNYLCPLQPVSDFLRMMRSWISEIWPKKKIKPAG
jgi:hypothetical protein